jgi:hypothetical protein
MLASALTLDRSGRKIMNHDAPTVDRLGGYATTALV